MGVGAGGASPTVRRSPDEPVDAADEQNAARRWLCSVEDAVAVVDSVEVEVAAVGAADEQSAAWRWLCSAGGAVGGVVPVVGSVGVEFAAAVGAAADEQGAMSRLVCSAEAAVAAVGDGGPDAFVSAVPVVDVGGDVVAAVAAVAAVADEKQCTAGRLAWSDGSAVAAVAGYAVD